LCAACLPPLRETNYEPEILLNYRKKQRHIAKRIYECLWEMGYGGKSTHVKETVMELMRVGLHPESFLEW
jgi:outer membrane phospholipase A